MVKIIGGLGNQMFQYALGRKIAYLNDETLKLDISGFETYDLHNYSLSHFNISGDAATKSEIRAFRGSNNRHIQGIINKMNHHGFYLPYLQKNKMVFEKTINYDPSVFDHTGEIYLDGYWQSEKYFKDIEGIIRNEFTIKTPPDSQNIKIANEIRNTEAVCIHVRRGDYVSNPTVYRSLGLCPLDYYYRAIEYVSSRVENPHFFIFSNDPSWTQQNMKINAPTTYICNNPPEKNFEDLRLMTLCKYFIIANSSFSWWGAWLSLNEKKIVIAPSQWYKGRQYNDEDRLPKEWIRL
ncbi:MAG: alpha-1,2-fucosyltransferase [Methanomicrobiaceae archaeon]|nr:alpha-1,2-fucosyltransferase [Methanomicrobiaceae archaeon]